MTVPARRIARAVLGPVVRTVRQASADRAQRRPVVEEVPPFVLEMPAKFRYHFLEQVYEPASLAFVREYVREGSVCLDVGAHIGYYALTMAGLAGATGRVIAVEPAADNLRFLRANFRRNPPPAPVQVIAAAASSSDGTATFHLTGSSDSHGLHPHPNTGTRRRVTVPTVRLDGSVRGKVDFFKVDTEGAEIETLEGMRGLLERGGMAAGLVEWAPQCQRMAGQDVYELPRYLEGLGFELTVLEENPPCRRPLAEVETLMRAGELPPGWYANLACLATGEGGAS